MTHTPLLPALLFLLASPALASGSNWHSVDGSSSIQWIANWQGNPVKGGFDKFAVEARGLDSANPAGAGLSMTLDTNSISAASPDITQALHGAEWFDINQHPQAGYTGRIDHENGDFEAKGELQLKGHTRKLDFPLTITRQGNNLVLKGQFTLQRSDFAIGSGQWSSGKTIALKVEVKFSITLTEDHAGQA